ncbi:hypothetical protein [Propionimicrobium sp. PCR01-08-3]|uniref:hypothetical protein n=1 Tax=Propionimicrobium sp. PCR01-08-3 TaxID=3052086 RepID=UPI00255C3484|nr:hypothetical protein [Propionimicrobium sp. PCR01-08-3]WIY81510.1 hypothetical protein QQ658_08135 [Propionimicrobium sp. PCR01-08-3]
MSDTTIIVLITVLLGLVAAGWAVLKWNSLHSPRHLMRATGAILLIVGAALVGLTGQVVTWIRHLSELSGLTWAGLIVAVLGLVAFFIGGAMKAPTKEEARLRELERATKQRDEDAKTAARADQKADKETKRLD